MTNLQHSILHEFQLPFTNPVLIFALILLIILLCPIILHKIKVPSIIGLIISGVIIGPYGLHLVDNDSATKLFSTIGLLYIMFIAGLELDMNEFSKNKHKSVIYSLLNFIAPPLLGFPLCYWGLGYSVTASMLLSCMLMTHTLVPYPIVSRMGITRDQSVIVTVGGTVLTDTVVLILLAIVMQYDQGITVAFLVKLGLALLVYLSAMFWTIPRLTAWFFRKMANEGYAMYTYVLVIVFLASFFAEIAGLEPIIGAFIAGLAINRHIPHSSVLMNRVDFVGNSIFIPFFLISVGMLVDVRAIMSGFDTIVLTIGLTVVAVISKWLVAYFAQRLFKYNKPQRDLIFGLSTAHAAATLAIILVGYNAGVLDETPLNATIILILITCVIASFTTEKAAKKVAITLKEQEDSELRNKIQEHQHILIPVSNIDGIAPLLDIALLIKEHNNDYPISLLSVVPNDKDAEINQLKVRRRLNNAIQATNGLETKVAIRTTISHNIPGAITRISRELLSDTIILGWPKQLDVFDRLVGDIIDQIVYTTEKTNVICGFEHNIIEHRRIVLVIPQYAEYERGFARWLSIVSKLARELSISATIIAPQKTCQAIDGALKEWKLEIPLTLISSEHAEDLVALREEVKEKDLICLVTSRKGYVSYNRGLEHLPLKLERMFPHHSRMVIYPQQNDEHEHLFIPESDMNN